MKFDEILKECKKLATISCSDYDDRRDYFSDCYTRNKDRKKLLSLAWRFEDANDDDVVIKYGRLTITSDMLDYCTCQYAPVEIYDAVFTALRRYIIDRDYKEVKNA